MVGGGGNKCDMIVRSNSSNFAMGINGIRELSQTLTRCEILGPSPLNEASGSW